MLGLFLTLNTVCMCETLFMKSVIHINMPQLVVLTYLTVKEQ